MTSRTAFRGSRRQGKRPRGRREPTQWTSGNLLEQTDVAGSQTVFDLLGGFTLTEKHNITGLVTIYYTLTYRATSPGVAIDGAMGVAVLEDDAIAASVFPEPLSDSDHPWAVHHFWSFLSSADESARLVGQGRSRRKIGVKESLGFSLEISGASGSVDWGIQTRILLQRGR